MSAGQKISSIISGSGGSYLGGGPPEGWLQRHSAAGRAVASLLCLLGVSFSQHAVTLMAVFLVVAVVSVVSFLDFGRAAMTALIPAVLFGVPTLAAGAFAHDGLSGGFWLIPLRVEVAATLALVMTESIGLIRISHLLGRGPLGVAWMTAVQQIRVMAKHVHDLELARRVRVLSPVGASELRRQVGRQASSFLVKCLMSADQRSLGLRSRGFENSDLPSPRKKFAVDDWLLILAGVVVLAVGIWF